MPPLLFSCHATLINFPPQPKPPKMAQREAECGFDGCRLTIYGKTVCVAPGKYDWTHVDESVDALQANRQQVLADPFTLPAWMSGGNPVYGYLVPDTCRWDTSKPEGFAFDDSKPYLTNPPAPDPQAVSTFGYDLGMHLIPKGVVLYSPWNEPDTSEGIFYAPMWRTTHTYNGDWSHAARRLRNEISVPFATGLLKASKELGVDIKLLGPENATQEFGRTALDFDAKADDGFRAYRDGIANHIYPPNGSGFPQASLDEADRRIVRYADVPGYTDPRHWFTEVSPDGGRTPDQLADDLVIFYRGMVARQKDVAAVMLYDNLRTLFSGDDTNYEPNAAYRALQAEILKAKGGKKRAVGKGGTAQVTT